MDSQISYLEWMRLVVPTNPVISRLLLGRNPVADRVSTETQELLKKLLRAHLNLEQAHEYLRQRLARLRGAEGWSLRQLFDAMDYENKGTLTIYDLEKLVIQQKRGGSRNIVEEVELLVALYDRSGYGKVSFVDFQNELIPRQQADM